MSRTGPGGAAILILSVTHRTPPVGIVGPVNEIVIHRRNDALAILCRPEDDPETSTPLATLYLMKDGWYMKLTHRHDRFAWSGPFAAPDEAIERYTPADVTGPIARIAV
jgi:hypothetical protein